MHSRRAFLLSLLALNIAVGAIVAANGAAAPPIEKPPLKDILQYDLRAKLPREVAFIDRVVFLVDTGVLPRKLVLSTFSWACNQSANYPFPYFEFALRAQARKLGVQL